MITVKKILCPIDFSKPSYVALDAAIGLAKQYSSEIILLHVIEPIVTDVMIGKMSYRLYQKRLTSDAKQTLRDIASKRRHQKPKINPMVKSGDPAKTIVRTAQQKRVDVIVIATHGRKGWGHLLFGSIAEKVVRLAPCPVLVIHSPKKRAGKRTGKKREK